MSRPTAMPVQHILESKQPECVADYSPPASAEVKHKDIFTGYMNSRNSKAFTN
jgi:hypothetical protein